MGSSELMVTTPDQVCCIYKVLLGCQELFFKKYYALATEIQGSAFLFSHR